MNKKTITTAVKICAFVIIANLPFLTMTQLLGINTFLDSFQHPQTYQYIKNNKFCLSETKGAFLIYEKPTSQGYTIEKGDTILYRTEDSLYTYRVVFSIKSQQGENTYYTTTMNNDDLDGPIYDYQIIGKVTSVIDDNLWNALSLQFWDISRANLNAVALFTNE